MLDKIIDIIGKIALLVFMLGITFGTVVGIMYLLKEVCSTFFYNIY